MKLFGTIEIDGDSGWEDGAILDFGLGILDWVLDSQRFNPKSQIQNPKSGSLAEFEAGESTHADVLAGGVRPV